MTLKDRIIEFIEFKGITTQNFEKKVGLSNAAVSKMGDNTRRTTLDKISNAFPELNQNWLLTGEGEMLKDMEGNIKERLVLFINTQNLSQGKFEKVVGLSNGYINGLKKSPGADKLQKIFDKFPELNQNWLLTGEGEMLKEMPAEEEVEVSGSIPATISYASGVPYYDETFECGFDELAPSSVINPNFYIRMPGYERATLWCNASGQSMAPEISNGDIIALQLVADPSFLPFGDIYAIVTTNDMRTIKRLGKSDLPDHYRLIPTNPAFEAQDIPMRMIRTVYKVLGAMKSFL